MILIAPIYFLLFFIPGFVCVLFLRKHVVQSNHQIFLTSLIFSFCITYVGFFIYFFNPEVGKLYSYVSILISFTLLAKKFQTIKNILPEIGFQFALVVFVYFFYISISEFYPVIINNRFLVGLPTDNELPWNFADCIYSHNDNVRECFRRGGFWLSSDRPPVFTSIILFLLPFKSEYVLGIDFYRYSGAVIQSTWILGLIFFLFSLGFRSSLIYYLSLLAITSGVFLINTVFLWPKLITVVPFVYGYFALMEDKTRSKPFLVAMGFISLALGFLMHGGILFSILSLFLLIFCRYSFSNKRVYVLRLIPYALVMVITIIPWTMYQKLYDPPGDHLLKMRMAGQRNLDDPILYPNHPRVKEGQTLKEAIVEAYSSVPTEAIIDSKIKNVQTLFFIPTISVDTSDFYVNFKYLNEWVKSSQFFYTFASQDFTLLGILFLPYSFSLASKRQRKSLIDLSFIALVSFGLWILLMFEPNATIIHQGSYFNLILILVILGHGAFFSPIRNILLVFHMLLFLFWIPDLNLNYSIYQWEYLVFSVVSFLLLVFMLRKTILFKK
ncbi:MAG: hypothetical protein O9264_10055 [Leptospira sp.]|nr:hypothetical protein [Leptospira sp.]